MQVKTETKPDNGTGAKAAPRNPLGRFHAGHLAIFWFVGWPFLSIVLGACYTRNAPTTGLVPFWMAFAGNATGFLYLIPEFLLSAAVLFAVSWVVFSLFPPADSDRRRRYLFEPVLAFFGVSLGISLEFPAILNNSIFTPIQSLSLVAGWAVILVFLIVVAVLRNGLHQKNVTAVAAPVILFVAGGWGLTQIPVGMQAKDVNKGATVILGIDSMGLLSDIDPLHDFAQKNGGAWYERAVTPGLLTNAVWAAIIQHRPVHETGTALTFQTPDWNRSPFQLVHEARQRGYQTWSYFTGQNTIYVGSMGGFEFDRSGPMGWLDNATVSVKNGSVFVSFIVSKVRHLPLSRVRRNQAGTYGYDLRAVVHNIFSRHEGSRPVFAVAHLGYLHNDCYPRMAQLSDSERRELLIARIDAIRDAGSDWQIQPVEGDPLNLPKWKYRHVQKVVTDELKRTGFLNPQNGNRLVILSDHGVRSGLTNDNFRDEKYYRVPLITFGVPVRDVHKPISLIDVSSLLGMEDPSSPEVSKPVVEYVNFESQDEFAEEIRSATWTKDGRINFSPEVVNTSLSLLKSYDPYPPQSDPVPSQVTLSQVRNRPTSASKKLLAQRVTHRDKEPGSVSMATAY